LRRLRRLPDHVQLRDLVCCRVDWVAQRLHGAHAHCQRQQQDGHDVVMHANSRWRWKVKIKRCTIYRHFQDLTFICSASLISGIRLPNSSSRIGLRTAGGRMLLLLLGLPALLGLGAKRRLPGLEALTVAAGSVA
jgi:hypothetical protein